ncbi:tetratricopeptide repeat protein [Pantoea sp. Aalb]|uniref:YfgM family protein n=1 Tax=Pantoea sp. Aalb TaxID=2576762 RepID=UPI001321CC99|nr:tetratricopeptide repeat protein [Pantoea sp. Aalb]MXP67260.1 tetratricopeptide repeat protein [Pantoea sp. Aalb]
MELYFRNKKLNSLNRCFSKNCTSFIFILIIGVISIAGFWYFWSNYQEKMYKVSSIQYQNLMKNIQTDKLKTMKDMTNFVIKNHNTYGALASLFLAKQYININQLSSAINILEYGLKDTKDINLQAIISLRLARIQIQNNQLNTALITLKRIKNNNWSSIIDYIHGEALLKKGDKDGARDIWTKVIKSQVSPDLIHYLQKKLNNLN